MKKFIIVIGSILCFALSGLNASAAEVYLGANYSRFVYSEIGFGDYQMGAVMLKIGVNMNKHLAFETRGGVGVAKDEKPKIILNNEFDTSLKLDNMYGVYVKGLLPLHNTFRAYMIAGHTQATMTAEVSLADNSESHSETEGDLSVGFGVELDVSENFAIVVEHMKYMAKAGFDASAVEIGFNIRF